jgi:hypothetical protein
MWVDLNNRAVAGLMARPVRRQKGGQVWESLTGWIDERVVERLKIDLDRQAGGNIADKGSNAVLESSFDTI